MQNIYNISVLDSLGNKIILERYKGKLLLIVNVASKCRFTPQYKELEILYKTYHNKGLEILGFPSNDFANQEPGTNEEIQSFCTINYGVTFPIYAKIHVVGKNIHPLFTYLTNQKSGFLGKKIKWNFTKFLVDQRGNVVKRFSPATKPKRLTNDIEVYL